MYQLYHYLTKFVTFLIYHRFSNIIKFEKIKFILYRKFRLKNNAFTLSIHLPIEISVWSLLCLLFPGYHLFGGRQLLSPSLALLVIVLIAIFTKVYGLSVAPRQLIYLLNIHIVCVELFHLWARRVLVNLI